MKKTLLFFICSITAAMPAMATSLRFTNVTVQAGITHVFTLPPTNVAVGVSLDAAWMYGGAVAEDFDGDGLTDLYFLQCGIQSNIFYRNRGDGTFTNESALRGVAFATNSAGVAAADYDNDGDVDMVVTRVVGPPYLLTNNGAGFFGKVELSGPTNLDSGSMKCFTSPSWGDINNDGQLDMVCGIWANYDQTMLYFYTNHNGTLTYWVPFDPKSVTNRYVFSPVFADLNGDHYADVLSVADYTNNTQLFINTGSNSFVVAQRGAGFGTDENGMGCAVGDYDNDGNLDVFVSGIMDTNLPSLGLGQTGSRLYKNGGKGAFSDATTFAGVRDGNWGWGCAFGDLDNDGDLDLVEGNGWPEDRLLSVPPRFNNQPTRLFENLGDGTFTNVAAEAGAADTGQNRTVILFDYDNDGLLDILIVNNQVLVQNGNTFTTNPAPPVLLHNISPNTNKWLNVQLAGTPPFHHHGIGSRAYITAGGRTQMRELNASTGFLGHGPNRIAHFGLNTNTVVDQVRAEWVNGDAVVLWNVGVNTNVSVPSPQGAVSSNFVHAGQLITAVGTAASPTGTLRRWIVDGQTTNADPFARAFYFPGWHELRLDIYATNNTTLLRSELHRVFVDSAVFSSVTSLGTNTWQVQWQAISNGVYRVETTAAFPTGSWAASSGIITSPAAVTQTRTVTNNAVNPIWRVLEFVP